MRRSEGGADEGRDSRDHEHQVQREKAQAGAEKAVDAHALQFFGRLSEAERQQLRGLLERLVGRSD
jgi:hypothetical protein